jgi:hypothetical protein
VAPLQTKTWALPRSRLSPIAERTLTLRLSWARPPYALSAARWRPTTLKREHTDSWALPRSRHRQKYKAHTHTDLGAATTGTIGCRREREKPLSYPGQ